MRDNQPDELKYENNFNTRNKGNLTVEQFKKETIYAGNKIFVYDSSTNKE